jgi:hypothetical protein
MSARRQLWAPWLQIGIVASAVAVLVGVIAFGLGDVEVGSVGLVIGLLGLLAAVALKRLLRPDAQRSLDRSAAGFRKATSRNRILRYLYELDSRQRR